MDDIVFNAGSLWSSSPAVWYNPPSLTFSGVLGKINTQDTDVYPPLPEELSSSFPVDRIQAFEFRKAVLIAEQESPDAFFLGSGLRITDDKKDKRTVLTAVIHGCSPLLVLACWPWWCFTLSLLKKASRAEAPVKHGQKEYLKFTSTLCCRDLHPPKREEAKDVPIRFGISRAKQ